MKIDNDMHRVMNFSPMHFFVITYQLNFPLPLGNTNLYELSYDKQSRYTYPVYIRVNICSLLQKSSFQLYYVYRALPLNSQSLIVYQHEPLLSILSNISTINQSAIMSSWKKSIHTHEIADYQAKREKWNHHFTRQQWK